MICLLIMRPEELRLIEKNWIGKEAIVSAVRRIQAKAAEICKAVSSVTVLVVILPEEGIRLCVPESRRVPLPVKKFLIDFILLAIILIDLGSKRPPWFLQK